MHLSQRPHPARLALRALAITLAGGTWACLLALRIIPACAPSAGYAGAGLLALAFALAALRHRTRNL